MSLDHELRSVLQRTADRCEAPAPDLESLVAGGRARRQRQRVERAVAGAAVAVVVVSTVLVVALGRLDTPGAGEPAGRPTPSPSIAPTGTVGMPYCVPRAGRDGRDILRGAGEDVETYCVFRHPSEARHHSYLWHHAGRTILASPEGVRLVDERGLVELDSQAASTVRWRHDGELVAWLVDSGIAESGPLVVHDLTTEEEVAREEVPSRWNHIAGIDDAGRVYVMSGGRRVEDPGDDLVLMHDLSTGRWTSVRGLPPTDHPLPITYLTADGFAFQGDAGVSIEGRVTPGGRFVPLRDVPAGQVSWSPDRSLALHLAEDGLRVSIADFSEHLSLDLPRPPHVGWWDAQWESNGTVLVTYVVVVNGEADPSDERTARCFVESGACEKLLRIKVPHSNQAHPGG